MSDDTPEEKKKDIGDKIADVGCGVAVFIVVVSIALAISYRLYLHAIR